MTTPTTNNASAATVFGYSWEQIIRVQQGGKLAELIRTSGTRPKATEKDLALLNEHGAQWLYDQGMFGVIDRLGLPLTA